MEFDLEELEATEDERRAAQDAAKAKTTQVASVTRQRPSRQHKVLQYVREKFTSRSTASPSASPARVCRSASRPWRTWWGPPVRRWRRPFNTWKQRCLPPHACMATTPPYRCWPRAGPVLRAPGSTRATAGHLPVLGHPVRCSTIHVTGRAFTRKPIWPDIAASSRPMLIAVATNSTKPTDYPGRSSRLPAGPMRGGNSSSRPISPATPDARLKAASRLLWRPWRWLRCSASMRSSRSAAAQRQARRRAAGCPPGAQCRTGR